MSLRIERVSCLVVPSRAKNVRSNEDPLPLLTALKWNSQFRARRDLNLLERALAKARVEEKTKKTA